MGLLFVLPGNDVSEKPGNSPCFQCFFLTTEEELEADAEGGDEIAKRVMGKIGTLGLGLRVLLNLWFFLRRTSSLSLYQKSNQVVDLQKVG